MTDITTIREDIWQTLTAGKLGSAEVIKLVVNTPCKIDRHYLELRINGEPWMNNFVAEDDSHRLLYETARGDVLLVGLGLGADAVLLRDKQEVKSIDVVDNNSDVVNLIGPQISHPKIKIINHDIFTWSALKKYDLIFFDILLDDIDLYPTEKTAMQTVGNLLKTPTGRIMFWTHPSVIQNI